jgi:hypothetical protein
MARLGSTSKRLKYLGVGPLARYLRRCTFSLPGIPTKVATRLSTNKKGLKKGAVELAFAVRDRCKKSGWLILTYDCSCYLVVETQQEAESILKATNWRKWIKKGR